MVRKKYRNVYLASYGIDGYTVRYYQRVSYDGIVGCLVWQVITPKQRMGKVLRKRVSANLGVFTNVTDVKSYEGGCKMIRDICMICGNPDCFSTKLGTLCDECLEKYSFGGKENGQQKSEYILETPQER